MRDMNIRGHAIFRGGDRIYSVNRGQEGYIVTPLEDDTCQYLAVRFDDRMVFLYRVPDDIPNNIYPLRYYRSLQEKHLVVEKAALIESRYQSDRIYRRIDCVHYDYSGTVKIDPPNTPKVKRRPRPTCSLDDVDQDILDIFEEAQAFTGKAEPGVEGFSPVAEMREFIGDHDE